MKIFVKKNFRRKIEKLFGDFFFKKVWVDFVFKKVAFWRSYGFLDVMGRCASTNDPRSFDYQLYTTFRRGVKVVHTVFEVVFGPKRTSTIWCYDVMIIRYDDTMIVCYRDSMILRIISELHKNFRVFKKYRMIRTAACSSYLDVTLCFLCYVTYFTLR